MTKRTPIEKRVNKRVAEYRARQTELGRVSRSYYATPDEHDIIKHYLKTIHKMEQDK